MAERLNIPDPRKLRNLVQYKDLTDEEFEAIFEEKYSEERDTREAIKSFEEEIDRKIVEFGEDYDLSDLKINDREILRALVQATLSLEHLELWLYKQRQADEKLGMDNILVFDKVNKVASDLRSDISKLQGDLKITRKIRQSDKTESVLAYLDDLKEKARKFYESRMMYVTCPKCNQALFSGWFLFPKAKNKLTFTCSRVIEDENTLCGNVFSITSEELLKNKGFNNLDVIPEGMQ